MLLLMGITQEQVSRYLFDYEKVFGLHDDRFFCPITRAFKPLNELMDGHVFSRQFECSKRTTVVQWGEIDHWFGSAYESHLLRFWLKVAPMTAEERLERGEYYFRFSTSPPSAGVSDASEEREYRAHLTTSKAGQQLTSPKAKCEYWKTTITTPFGEREFVAQGLDRVDLPRLPYVYLWERTLFRPMMVSAAMMKAGFLTLFWLMGYECLRNPLVALVGDRLAQSFEANAREADAFRFWSEFENAYGLIEDGRDGHVFSDSRPPWYFDTISSRNALELHHNDIQFAFVFVYDVDGVTVTATFPFTRRPEDAETAWRHYQAYLRGEVEVREAMQSQWDQNLRKWQPVGAVAFREQRNAFDHAKYLARAVQASKERQG